MPVHDDRQSVAEENLFDPEDFRVVMNPKLHSQTVAQSYDWEYCLSFPGIKCMVKRPAGIKVSYLDAGGDIIEQKLTDFSARVFLHEMDHINGRTMTHWKLSEGNIEVFEGKQDDNRHLMSTIEFYKTKITEMKEQHSDWNLFEEKQKFDKVIDKGDG